MSEWHTGWTEGYASARSEAEAEILHLRANSEKLRAALMPFAEHKDIMKNDYWKLRDDNTSMVKFGDLRAAAAALKENKE